MSDVVLAILGSGAFTTLVTAIINNYVKKKENNSLSSKGIMCLMGYEIKKECERIIISGTLTMSDYKQLQELNEVYHALGGNGYVKSLLAKVEQMKIEGEN